MSHLGSKGFVLLVVLMLIAVFGGMLALLTAGSQRMMAGTERLERAARTRCLQASAAAWARRHGDDLARRTELDVAALGVSRGRAVVEAPAGGPASPVVIRTSCTVKGRTTHTRLEVNPPE
jgi:Tfp pilus assembly protein PilX